MQALLMGTTGGEKDEKLLSSRQENEKSVGEKSDKKRRDVC